MGCNSRANSAERARSAVGRRETTMRELDYSLRAFALNACRNHRKICGTEPNAPDKAKRKERSKSCHRDHSSVASIKHLGVGAWSAVVQLLS